LEKRVKNGGRSGCRRPTHKFWETITRSAAIFYMEFYILKYSKEKKKGKEAERVWFIKPSQYRIGCELRLHYRGRAASNNSLRIWFLIFSKFMCHMCADHWFFDFFKIYVPHVCKSLIFQILTKNIIVCHMCADHWFLKFWRKNIKIIFSFTNSLPQNPSQIHYQKIR